MNIFRILRKQTQRILFAMHKSRKYIKCFNWENVPLKKKKIILKFKGSDTLGQGNKKPAKYVVLKRKD